MNPVYRESDVQGLSNQLCLFYRPTHPHSRLSGTILVAYDNGWLIPVYDAQNNIAAWGRPDGSFSSCESVTLGCESPEADPEQIMPSYTFSSKEYDKETNLLYFGHRFLSPTIGRWLSRDPIGERDSGNLYMFVNNNPLLYYDRDGLLSEPVFDFDISPCKFLGLKEVPASVIDAGSLHANAVTLGHATVKLIVDGKPNAQKLDWSQRIPCSGCFYNGFMRELKENFSCSFEIQYRSGFDPFVPCAGARSIWDHEIHAHVMNFIQRINDAASFIRQVGSICAPEQCDRIRLKYLSMMQLVYYHEELIHGAEYDYEDYPKRLKAKYQRLSDDNLASRNNAERAADEYGRLFTNCISDALPNELRH